MRNFGIRVVVSCILALPLTIALTDTSASPYRSLALEELRSSTGFDDDSTLETDMGGISSCAAWYVSSNPGSGVISGFTCGPNSGNDICVYCGTATGQNDQTSYYPTSNVPSDEGAQSIEPLDCGMMYQGVCDFDMVSQSWKCYTQVTNVPCNDYPQNDVQDTEGGGVGNSIRMGPQLEAIRKN